MTHSQIHWTRRQLITGAGAAGLASLLPARTALGRTLLGRVFNAPAPRSFMPQGGGCVLSPAETEGPYYFNAALQRADITEGRAGFPLVLDLRVVRASSCAPVAGAIVDIWHADAGGLYAGYATGQLGNVDTSGQNFLRGVQLTDQNGWARFHTVYPGWYPGRTVHIHFKVILSNLTAITSQLYFPDTLTDEVFAAVDPYSTRGARNTRNTQDMLYQAGLLTAASVGRGGVSASFTIGIA